MYLNIKQNLWNQFISLSSQENAEIPRIQVWPFEEEKTSYEFLPRHALEFKLKEMLPKSSIFFFHHGASDLQNDYY